MTPDEVVVALAAKGIKLTRKTIYNYEMQGLISKPLLRTGKSCHYPTEVVEQAIEAHMLMSHQLEFYRTKYLPLKNKMEVL